MGAVRKLTAPHWRYGMSTEWRVIPSCLDYEVGEFGDVRRKNNRYPIKSRFHKGYEIVTITVNGKKVTKFVHRLVAEAFIGPRPKGHHTHHKNHNMRINHYTNLEYLKTYSHFNEHRDVRQRHCTKLIAEQVLQIRAMYIAGNYTYKQLAQAFNVSITEIHKIVKRKVWKHI